MEEITAGNVGDNDNEFKERRRSERVQFFQLATDKDIEPIWVFRQTYPEAILGLLLDINAVGVQVLTNKAHELTGDTYRMIVHAGDEVVTVRRRWSALEGTLYMRNGFAFDEQANLPALLTALAEGASWLRCELLPLEPDQEQPMP
jgi:hypothetical protein